MASSLDTNAAAKLLARIMTLAAMLVLVACSSTKYPPAPISAATPEYRYLIGPLDTVNIIVWRNPELSLSVPVRPDGFISTPLVEDLPAIGRNPSDLARDLEKALGKYARDPIVTVVVTAFAGAPIVHRAKLAIVHALPPRSLARQVRLTRCGARS